MFSVFTAEYLSTALFSGSQYIGLHTEDPTSDGSVGELTGGGYARQAISWGAGTDEGDHYKTATDTDIEFPTGSADLGLVTHMSVWNADTAGDCLIVAALEIPRNWVDGGIMIIPAGELFARVRY